MISILGLALSIWIFSKAMKRAGNGIPIFGLLLLIAALQWVVGPWLSYTFFDDHYKYHMYVPEEEYMWLAVPSLLFLSLGLLFRKQHRSRYEANLITYAQGLIQAQPTLPYWLIGLGIFFSFAGAYVPSFLKFVFFLACSG